jgi:hypothetical protein
MKKSILALSTLVLILALSLFTSISLSISVPKMRVKFVTSWQDSNWAGYVAETSLSSPQNGSVTDVQGSWVVPSANTPLNSLAGFWVGIDGYYDNASTVEQIGTACVVNPDGSTTYYAWYEMYPALAVTINDTVSPGDLMSAEVSYIGSGTFCLSIVDYNHWSYSTNQTRADAPRNSAEWIVEGPALGGPITPLGVVNQTEPPEKLANFGSVDFTSCLATLSGVQGSIGSASWQNVELAIMDSSGNVWAQPTPLLPSGTEFQVSTLIYTIIDTISPTSITLDVGQPQTFTSNVYGGIGSYSYNWYLNGAPVSGATSSSWTFTPSSTGSYSVIMGVWDSKAHGAMSNTASVTVNPALSVTIAPTSVTILFGQSVTFTSSATGGIPPYSYQWFLNGAPVSGATGWFWTFSPTSTGDYTVNLVVKDAAGSAVTSNSASVTVCGGYGCVLKNTRILMANGGTMPVQALKPGDEIVGYDVQTGTFVTETVTSNNCTTVDEILSINNGLLYLTPTDQPIYTDHGWIRDPQDLRIGWKIYDPAKNAWITISNLETLKGHFQVYDLRATAPNNFIANGILLDRKVS